jgi:Icc-related predicted phosphoesterase
MIRIAAVADIHFAEDLRGTLLPHFEQLGDKADVLLIAGDFTRHGEAEEAAVFADEVEGLDVPVVAVLGNHDYHLGEEKAIADVLQQAGVDILEGEARTLNIDNTRLGVAGTKGFGGGFVGASATEFGEPEMKSFVRHSIELAESLSDAVSSLDADTKIVLTHYSPIETTLKGERPEIYPFLGSYLLAEAIDGGGADLALHGHAHGGTEKGVTPGGVHVRNVAQPLIQKPYALFCLGADQDLNC